MAIIHPTIVIESGSTMPTLGTLLGTRVSTEVFDNVNGTGYSSFFGSDFEHMGREFFDRHVAPMNRIGFQIERSVALIMNPDSIRALTSVVDFERIPLSMEMPILLFEPVRKLFEEGRVEGWGYHPDTLPQEDMYGRLIDNFTCEDVQASSDSQGYYDISATLYSDDENFSDDQLDAIRRTRAFILNGILKDTDRDPTCIALPRG